jgi:tetratricopeptide (TPR) repeat protein
VPRLARAIARRLKLHGAAAAALCHVEQRMAEDPAAREAFYRGKYLLGRHSVDAYRSAVAAFAEAIALAPDFALAWIGKAQAHLGMTGMSARPPAEDIDAAHAAVSRALELEPELGSAHATAATLASTYARDWVRAERASLEAIRYAPGSAYAHHSYGWMLVFTGRFAEAEETFSVARELDPLDPQLQAHQLLLRFYRRDFAGAATGYAEVLAREPSNLVARVLQATALIGDGRTDAARGLFEGIATDLPGDSIGPLGIVQAWGAGGDIAQARIAFGAMVDRFGEPAIGPYRMAIAHARLEDIDAAFAWLERAEAARDMNIICTAVDPSFDRLRDDPRWPALLQRFGFPPIDPRPARA